MGGVAVLALLGFGVFWFLKRRGNKDEFDGNFDPDRVVGHSTGGGTLPQIDLGDEVTPYEYSPGAGGGGMTEYGDSPYLAAGAAGATSHRSTSPPSGYAPSEYYNQPPSGNMTETSGSNYAPSSGAAHGLPAGAAAAVGWAAGGGDHRAISPDQSTSSYSNPRSAKEREAMAARYGRQPGQLGLATQHEEAGGSDEGPVVVHRDGGRVREDPGVEPPREIPPTYDSIPADERDR